MVPLGVSWQKPFPRNRDDEGDGGDDGKRHGHGRSEGVNGSCGGGSPEDRNGKKQEKP